MDRVSLPASSDDGDLVRASEVLLQWYQFTLLLVGSSGEFLYTDGWLRHASCAMSVTQCCLPVPSLLRRDRDTVQRCVSPHACRTYLHTSVCTYMAFDFGLRVSKYVLLWVPKRFRRKRYGRVARLATVTAPKDDLLG